MAMLSCDRRGVIRIGDDAPRGDLVLASATRPERLMKAVQAIARHGYDNATWLVPGVPEADNDDAAMEAVVAFQERLHRHLRRHPDRSGGRA